MKRKLSKDNVADLLTLFQQGWRQSSLSRKYQIDHSTVYYYCKKFNLVRSGNPIQAESIETLTEKPVKMYADYLKESKERDRINRRKAMGLHVENSSTLVL